MPAPASQPVALSRNTAAPLIAQGPTVWQACMSELADNLQQRGEDPRGFAFLVGGTHFTVFAVGEHAAFCLSVFERKLIPLTLSPGQPARMKATLTEYPFPLPWGA